MRSAALAALLSAACGATITGDPPTNSNVDASTEDGALINEPDGPPADAYMLGPWGTPQPMTAINSGAAEDDATMTWGGTEIVFARDDGAQKHLYFSSLVGGVWQAPVKAPFSANADERDETPRYGADDLTLYFASSRNNAIANSDVYVVTRTAVGQPWSAPAKLAALSTGTTDKWVSPCPTEFLMIRTTAGNGQSEIYGGSGLANPAKIVELDSNAGETGTFLTQDCLTMYFASTRDGDNDLWMSHRTATTVPWQAPTKFTTFGTAFAEQDPWISNDGRTFLFASSVTGAGDIYMVTR